MAVNNLKLAGRTDAPFSDEAIGLIHQVSRGLPRSVNNLVRQALVATFANKSAIVNEKVTRQAISEADSRTPDMGDKVQEMPGRSLTENRMGRLVSG